MTSRSALLRSGLQRIGHWPIALACVASLMAAPIALAESDVDWQRSRAARAGFTGTIHLNFCRGSGDP